MYFSSRLSCQCCYPYDKVAIISNYLRWNNSEGCPCLSPEKDLSPQVVPDAIEVLLIEQNFTDGPVKGTVGQVGHDVLPATGSTDQYGVTGVYM